jgi:hypothetical protein
VNKYEGVKPTGRNPRPPQHHKYNKNMGEPNDRAEHIFNKMGVLNGKKHITQMLYLVKGINSLDLYEYWAKVEIEFKNLKHGY